MNNCKGIFGWLFGHKFEGHYNSTSTVPGNLKIENGLSSLTMSGYEQAALISELKNDTDTFVCCVCKRCGQTAGEEKGTE